MKNTNEQTELEDCAPSARDSRLPSPARQQAHATRQASASQIQLLSPPAPDAVAPDDRFGPTGMVRPMWAYGMGSTPPPLPPDAVGHQVQPLGVMDTAGFVFDRLAGVFAVDRTFRRELRGLLRWLGRFPGAGWEQRWLASGADSAPRTWRQGVHPTSAPGRIRGIGRAGNALLLAGVLRPSYGWLLDAGGGTNMHEKTLRVHDPEGYARLRALPAHQQVLPTIGTPTLIPLISWSSASRRQKAFWSSAGDQPAALARAAGRLAHRSASFACVDVSVDDEAACVVAWQHADVEGGCVIPLRTGGRNRCACGSPRQSLGSPDRRAARSSTLRALGLTERLDLLVQRNPNRMLRRRAADLFVGSRPS